MVDELRKVLELMKEANERCGNTIVSSDEFKEEEENLRDFSGIPAEITSLLIEMQSIPVADVDAFMSNMHRLHLKLSDSKWHIEQVHELVKKVLTSYRDSV